MEILNNAANCVINQISVSLIKELKMTSQELMEPLFVWNNLPTQGDLLTLFLHNVF